jgi:hypothetical protein
MNDEVELDSRAASATGRRKPGTGFPVVSLAEASRILREAGKFGFEHSLAEFAAPPTAAPFGSA